MLNQNTVETGIDRSIGVLFFGLAVTAFMLLTVIGMGRVQRNAEDATGTQGSRGSAQQVQTDLGG